MKHMIQCYLFFSIFYLTSLLIYDGELAVRQPDSCTEVLEGSVCNINRLLISPPEKLNPLRFIEMQTGLPVNPSHMGVESTLEFTIWMHVSWILEAALVHLIYASWVKTW